jgi:signal transduction histidine kinase
MSLGRIRRLLFGSVRRQLIVGVAGVHAVMMSLFVWDLTERQQAMLLDQQTSQAIALAQSVATSAATWLTARDLTGLQEIIEAQQSHPELRYAMAVDRHGTILAHTERQYLGQYLGDLPAQADLHIYRQTPELVDVISPAIVAGRQVGWIRVGIGQDKSQRQSSEITRDGMLYALAAILVGAILAGIMGSRLTRRLYLIQRVADDIQSGRTQLRAEVPGDDEAARLARQFNRMLDALTAQAQALAKSHAALRDSEADVRRLNAGLTQRVRERTAQLEAVVKELESFSYSVSHDLRAPLRAIDGFASALEEDYADRLDDEGRDYLRRIRHGALRMADLIDDLLKLSRVSRSELTSQPVDLSGLAREILDRLAEAEPLRAVATAVQPGLGAQGDPGLLRAALENLLGNAWKYSSKQAQARIEFGAGEQAGETVYFVRDNGIGFDMAHAGKLFGPFQRLHHQNEFEGSGIGLATVRRIIQRHGGRIWAESMPGQGATFYFTLGDATPG